MTRECNKNHLFRQSGRPWRCHTSRGRLKEYREPRLHSTVAAMRWLKDWRSGDANTHSATRTSETVCAPCGFRLSLLCLQAPKWQYMTSHFGGCVHRTQDGARPVCGKRLKFFAQMFPCAHTTVAGIQSACISVLRSQLYKAKLYLDQGRCRCTEQGTHQHAVLCCVTRPGSTTFVPKALT